MRQRDDRKARLRKETIRKLDARLLAPGELEQVAGGARKPYTCDCPTDPTCTNN